MDKNKRSNWNDFKEILDQHHITRLYHFTDRDNLESIIKNGGLYSWADCDEKGIKYIEKTGTKTDEVQAAADALIAEGVDAVFTPTDNTIQQAELGIYEKFLEAGIPHYAGADSFALNGAFMGYGVDYSNLGVATADTVAEILLDGKDTASLAVKTFDNGIATINTDSCEALGLSLDTVKSEIQDLCTQIVETKTEKEFSN